LAAKTDRFGGVADNCGHSAYDPISVINTKGSVRLKQTFEWHALRSALRLNVGHHCKAADCPEADIGIIDLLDLLECSILDPIYL